MMWQFFIIGILIAIALELAFILSNRKKAT